MKLWVVTYPVKVGSSSNVMRLVAADDYTIQPSGALMLWNDEATGVERKVISYSPVGWHSIHLSPTQGAERADHDADVAAVQAAAIDRDTHAHREVTP